MEEYRIFFDEGSWKIERKGKSTKIYETRTMAVNKAKTDAVNIFPIHIVIEDQNGGVEQDITITAKNILSAYKIK